jgi:hypothetical protein
MLFVAIEMSPLLLTAKVAIASRLETRCSPRTPVLLGFPGTYLHYDLEKPGDGL